MASTNFTAFWDIEPCSFVEVERCFRAAYCFHHQDDREGNTEQYPWRFLSSDWLHTGYVFTSLACLSYCCVISVYFLCSLRNLLSFPLPYFAISFYFFRSYIFVDVTTPQFSSSLLLECLQNQPKFCFCDKATEAWGKKTRLHIIPGRRILVAGPSDHAVWGAWMLRPWVRFPLETCMLTSSVHHHLLITISSALRSPVQCFSNFRQSRTMQKAINTKCNITDCQIRWFI
jgi:hypothetical protein